MKAGREIVPICIGCDRKPPEISEYKPAATGMFMDANTYVVRNEGTYNKENGHFYCTSCYVKAGMPLGVAP